MWSKKILEWTEYSKAYISVVFTWQLPEAWSRCVWYRQQGYDVITGGPATALFPDYLSKVSSNHLDIECLSKHNPDATRTSYGCINKCSFCAVPITEGDLTELEKWKPKPLVCDNNLTACSRKHFDKVIDSLKGVKGVDFNQGLDCRLLNCHHIERLRELDLECIRFAWDNINCESYVFNAIQNCVDAGIPKSKIRVYVLIGYHDTPEDALYRMQALKDYGLAKNSPMRFQPISGDKALIKDSYLEKPWTEYEMKRFMHYWFRQAWVSNIPYSDWRG